VTTVPAHPRRGRRCERRSGGGGPNALYNPRRKRAANRGFFYAGSNRSRRQRARKTSHLTCIVTGCRQRADWISYHLFTIGDPIAAPSGDDVSSSDDIGGSNGDFWHKRANAGGNVVCIGTFAYRRHMPLAYDQHRWFSIPASVRCAGQGSECAGQAV